MPGSVGCGSIEANHKGARKSATDNGSYRVASQKPTSGSSGLTALWLRMSTMLPVDVGCAI
jgi:hypothetical protein